MALFFKHLSFSDPEKWGAIGFPRRADGGSYLGALREYKPEDRVLLALPLGARDALAGHIFAVAQIGTEVLKSAQVFPPEVPSSACRCFICATWKAPRPLIAFLHQYKVCLEADYLHLIGSLRARGPPSTEGRRPASEVAALLGLVFSEQTGLHRNACLIPEADSGRGRPESRHPALS